MIKGKSVEEIRKMFNIVNDFTPEEEEQIRKVVYRMHRLSHLHRLTQLAGERVGC